MTPDEIRIEIGEINRALSDIRKAGQSYLIMSASGGGSQRSVTMADYDRLKKHRDELQQQLDSMTGRRGIRFTPGW